jgi:5-oxoprolinase (ATP-hydrolysing)
MDRLAQFICYLDPGKLLQQMLAAFDGLLFSYAGSVQALQAVTDTINADAAKHGLPAKSVHEVALGFVDVANEAMCRPIRALTQARGLDVSQHILACFGGAGGQHACAIARQLGMRTVFVHRYASILCAVGMGLASMVQEEQVRC